MDQQTLTPQDGVPAKASPIVRAAAAGHDEDFFGGDPLWTPEVNVASQKVIDWVRSDLPGASIWGLPGCGKSEFGKYMALVASAILGAGVFTLRLDVPPDAQDDSDELMLEWGRQAKVPGYHHPKQAVRKGRFVDVVTARAAAGGGTRVLIIIDSAHLLGEIGFELLTSLSEAIGDPGLRPFVLLIGQLELREALKEFKETLALQMHRRYFLRHHTFVGIDPADLEQVLDSFDAVAAPSVTQVWLAHRAAENWTLSRLATPLRKAISSIAEEKNLTRGVRIPMSILRPSINTLVYELIGMGDSLADIDEAACVRALKGVDFDSIVQHYVAQQIQ
jgi:hypothetical protein